MGRYFFQLIQNNGKNTKSTTAISGFDLRELDLI